MRDEEGWQTGMARAQEECGKRSKAVAMESRAAASVEGIGRDVCSSSHAPAAVLSKFAGEGRRTFQGQRPSLLNLCVATLGRHLEDIMDEIHFFAPICPAPLKATLMGIARRRGLLFDTVLVALADESWELLDVSGSDVTDAGIQAVVQSCPKLQAVDISRCNHVTSNSIRLLVQCPSLHTLRCGGTIMSNGTAIALGYILPKLNVRDEPEDCWEALDTKAVGRGAESLRWLVWPSIDKESRELLQRESPRVVINPKPYAKGFQHLSIPREAHPGEVLDAAFVKDINPDTWSIMVDKPRAPAQYTLRDDQTVLSKTRDDNPLLSLAERFKLAFLSRDERLAPKRAKNLRQNQRRAEKAWMNSDTEAKARAWARQARMS